MAPFVFALLFLMQEQPLLNQQQIHVIQSTTTPYLQQYLQQCRQQAEEHERLEEEFQKLVAESRLLVPTAKGKPSDGEVGGYMTISKTGMVKDIHIAPNQPENLTSAVWKGIKHWSFRAADHDWAVVLNVNFHDHKGRPMLRTLWGTCE